MEQPKGKAVEFLVEGRPEIVLGLVRGYFESDEWPHRGDVRGPGGIIGPKVAADVPLPRSPLIPNNPLGCLVLLVLSVATLGVFAVGWLLWTMVAGAPAVVVTGVAAGPGSTRLVIEAPRPEHAEPLEAWIRRELVEGRAAAATQGQPASPDIPTQIRELAELRDAGVIIDEEFQAKKSALLDRM